MNIFSLISHPVNISCLCQTLKSSQTGMSMSKISGSNVLCQHLAYTPLTKSQPSQKHTLFSFRSPLISLIVRHVGFLKSPSSFHPTTITEASKLTRTFQKTIAMLWNLTAMLPNKFLHCVHLTINQKKKGKHLTCG